MEAPAPLTPFISVSSIMGPLRIEMPGRVSPFDGSRLSSCLSKLAGTLVAEMGEPDEPVNDLARSHYNRIGLGCDQAEGHSIPPLVPLALALLSGISSSDEAITPA